MPFTGTQVTVSTAPVLLVTGRGTLNDSTPAIVTNQDAANSVYLGGPAVDATGYELKAGVSLGVTVTTGESLYGYAASSVRVDVLKGRQ